MKTPKNVQNLLKKIKQKDSDIAEFCISHAEKALQDNGYKDARLWATTILSALIGELKYVEDDVDLESLVLELDGIERNVAEALYDAYTHIADSAKNIRPKDVSDTIFYSVITALDSMDKKKYRNSYG